MTNTNNQARVAVVTGASSGIGEATARALAADGYRVALLARRVDRITALADELGNGSIAIQADVTDRDSIVAAAERVQHELGGADVLVNNAGVMLLGPFATDQRDDYRQMIEVNLLGAITRHRGLPRPAQGRRRRARRRHRQHLLRRRAHRPGGQRRLRGDQVGPQRLVRVAAPGAAPRRARHPRSSRAWSRPSSPTTSRTTRHAQGVQRLYDQAEVTADDVAEVIAFVLSRPRHLAINEVLLRPAGQL